MRLRVGDPASGGMAIAGAVLLLAALGFVLAVPKPDPVRAARDATTKARSLETSTRVDRKSADAASAQTAKLLWSEPDSKIPPAILGRVNALAAKCGVVVTSFRPQKPTPVGTLELQPYAAAIAGPFPKVLEFERQVEESGSSLAVSLLQISGTESGSDKVTMTLGLNAYADPARSQGPPLVEKKDAAAKPLSSSDSTVATQAAQGGKHGPA